MARITVEDCLKKADNRFSLVHLAARRVRQLKKGDPPRIQCKNREIVTALREIAAGVITIETLKEIDEHLSRRYEPPVLAPPVESEPTQPAEETAVSPESAPAEEPAEEKTEDAAEEPAETAENEPAENTEPEESTESEEGAEPEEEGEETDAERL